MTTKKEVTMTSNKSVHLNPFFVASFVLRKLVPAWGRFLQFATPAPQAGTSFRETKMATETLFFATFFGHRPVRF